MGGVVQTPLTTICGAQLLQHIPPRQSVDPGTDTVPVSQVLLVGEPHVPPKLAQVAVFPLGLQHFKPVGLQVAFGISAPYEPVLQADEQIPPWLLQFGDDDAQQ